MKKYLDEIRESEEIIKTINVTNDSKLFFIIQEDDYLENHYVVLKFYDFYDLDNVIFSADTPKEFKAKCKDIIFNQLKPYITFEELNTVYDINKDCKYYQDNLWLNL